MKTPQWWFLAILRLCLVVGAIGFTAIGEVIQKKQTGFVGYGGLFLVCAVFVLGLPCYRILDSRFCAKHGLDVSRWLRYGLLGTAHGATRWIFLTVLLAKFLAVPERGWSVLLQIPALIALSFALHSGYPGLESYGGGVRYRNSERARKRARKKGGKAWG